MKKLWLIQVLRGVLCMGIGITILAEWLDISLPLPGGAVEQMLLFIGIYWLSSGIMSLVWGYKVANNRGMYWKVSGLLAIIGGLFIILRTLLDDFMDPSNVLTALASVFVLNGFIHITDAHRNPEDAFNQQIRRSPFRLSFLLGIIEILVGGYMFYFWDTGNDQVIVLLALTWSVIGGLRLMIRGLRLRKISKKVQKIA